MLAAIAAIAAAEQAVDEHALTAAPQRKELLRPGEAAGPARTGHGTDLRDRRPRSRVRPCGGGRA
jgi:hypothetical protein